MSSACAHEGRSVKGQASGTVSPCAILAGCQHQDIARFRGRRKTDGQQQGQRQGFGTTNEHRWTRMVGAVEPQMDTDRHRWVRWDRWEVFPCFLPLPEKLSMPSVPVREIFRSLSNRVIRWDFAILYAMMRPDFRSDRRSHDGMKCAPFRKEPGDRVHEHRSLCDFESGGCMFFQTGESI